MKRDAERYTAGTGIITDAPDRDVLGERLRRLDRPGEHLWVYAGAWLAADPRAAEAQLDAENLLSIQGPGCYKCEQPFSNRLARRPCRGNLEGK